MIRSAIVVVTTAMLGCSPAFAQMAGSNPSPLGMTSPLGMGPGSPVAPTGIPLGATELASPGVSPMTSGASPLGPATGVTATCVGGALSQASPGVSNSMTSSSSLGSSSAGTSGSTTIFDGGGVTGTASGTCAAVVSSPSGSPAASASSPAGMGSASSGGRAGIPMGSTELGAGGLSPPLGVLIPNPSAPSVTQGTGIPCPVSGTAVAAGMSSGSC
jgi:hypothetical protein